MPRDLAAVVQRVIDIAQDEDMQMQLRSFLRDLRYTAPESMQTRWMDFCDVVNQYIPYVTDVATLPPWQGDVIRALRDE